MVKKSFKKIIPFLAIFCMLFLTAGFVFGAIMEVKYPTIMGKSLNNNSTIADMVCYFFNAGVFFAIIIALCAVAAGGIMYLIDYGRGKFTNDAKDWIKSALLGLLIIVTSVVVIETINPTINECKIAYLPKININISERMAGENSYTPPIDVYTEYPIGSLTEYLLTEVGLCGNSDAYGDIRLPPPSTQTGGGTPSTTPNKTQDRVACLIIKVEAAQKQMQVAAVLAQKITKLMELCSCRCRDANGDDQEASTNHTDYTQGEAENEDKWISKCKPECDLKGNCMDDSGYCSEEDGKGNGEGKNNCQLKKDTYDCCPLGIKEIIEHGPIFVPEEELPNPGVKYPKEKIQGTEEPEVCIFSPHPPPRPQYNLFEYNDRKIELLKKIANPNKKVRKILTADDVTGINANGRPLTQQQKEAIAAFVNELSEKYPAGVEKIVIGEPGFKGKNGPALGEVFLEEDLKIIHLNNELINGDYAYRLKGTITHEYGHAVSATLKPEELDEINSIYKQLRGTSLLREMSEVTKSYTQTGGAPDGAEFAAIMFDVMNNNREEFYNTVAYQNATAEQKTAFERARQIMMENTKPQSKIETQKQYTFSNFNLVLEKIGAAFASLSFYKLAQSIGEINAPPSDNSTLGKTPDTGNTLGTGTNNKNNNSGTGGTNRKIIDIGQVEKGPVSTGSGKGGGAGKTVKKGISDPEASKEVGTSGSTSQLSSCQLYCQSDADCPNGGTDLGEVCDKKLHKCGKYYKGLDEFRCKAGIGECRENGEIIERVITKVGTMGTRGAGVIYPSTWEKLTLWHKIEFYRQSIIKWPDLYGINEDIANLKKAKTAMNTSTCYQIRPANDLFADYEVTDQKTKNKNRIVLINKLKVWDEKKQKYDNLYGSISGQAMDSQKYCKGFNYNDSVCFKQCNDMCPDYTEKVLKGYINCKKEGDDQSIANCINQVYNQRSCTKGGKDDNFEKCIKTCREECSKACNYFYPRCSEELKFCKKKCDNNGGCILKNANNCVFNSKAIIECAKQFTGQSASETYDEAGAKLCLERAYACQYGSKQNSGFSDCVESAASYTKGQAMDYYTNKYNQYAQGCSASNNISSTLLADDLTNRPSLRARACLAQQHCTWDAPTEKCVMSYPPLPETKPWATDLWQNKNQKCPGSVYNLISNNVSSTNNSVSNNSNNSAPGCIESYPETQKCPTGDDCPFCPCNEIDKFEYTALQKSCFGNNTCGSDCVDGNPGPIPGSNAGREGYLTKTYGQAVHQMVGPQCMEYAYNQDPLTFYCLNDWWNNPKKEKSETDTAIGKEKRCDQRKNIPVGQTVDHALGWAQNLVDSLGKSAPFLTEMKKYQDFMKKIGSAINTNPVQNYCKCNAKCQNNKKLCENKCQHNQIDFYDDFGVKIDCVQWCEYEMCKGQPCQQMINWQSDLWDLMKKYKEGEYIKFYSYLLSEPRSDILKKLTYSRTTMDACSVTSTNYGGAENRIISCTTAEDELLPPINQLSASFQGKNYPGYCYGQKLGRINNISMADDWFCCERYVEYNKQSPNKNPIYDPSKNPEFDYNPILQQNKK